MSRDDIIRMAREAGLTESNHHSKILVRHSNGSWVDVEQVLTRFAALVAAAEREACAKVAEVVAREIDDTNGTATYITAAIRARGESATREERRAHDERYLQATVEQTRTGRFA